MKLRYYQQDAVDAIRKYLCANDGNPCVELPTGAGKSLVIAELVRLWAGPKRRMRVLVLAHRKELVQQNHDELQVVYPEADCGIYAAGLRRKDTDHPVIFASIDSLVNKPDAILVPHVVIIDEAHCISPKAGTKYQKLLDNFKTRNPSLRVVGLTATPYRMDSGDICHDDFALTDLVYSAPIGKLMDDGYLCKLRSRIERAPDVSKVRKNSKGDFITSSLASVVDVPGVVKRAVTESLETIERENRQGVMWFCVNQQHCEHVNQCLMAVGYNAPIVTAKTPVKERDRIVELFKNRKLRMIINIDVYTTGFNAKHVDCIVMLRPTLSKGLYAQIVGRGLRIHPDKKDCLVLDYGGNIERHGPIDGLSAERVRLHKCGECGDSFAFPLGACPHCGTEIPKQKREAVEAEERERKLNNERMAQAEIMGATPVEYKVDEVNVFRHSKPNAPDTLRVEYRCGLNTFREWICLDHESFAGKKARQWWLARFDEPIPTVNEALDGMFEGFTLGQKLTEMTIAITTKKTGKYHEIIWHQIKGRKT